MPAIFRSGSLENDEGYVFVHGSILDDALIAELLDTHKPDAIVNFAAESHVDRSIKGPRAFVETNVMGTFSLLEAARHYWHALDGEERAFPVPARVDR